MCDVRVMQERAKKERKNTAGKRESEQKHISHDGTANDRASAGKTVRKEIVLDSEQSS